MFGRRRPPASADVHRSFWAVAKRVEEAKEALVASVPGPRREPRPLAPALSDFEDGLRQASEGMGAWRRLAGEDVWDRCRAGLEEAARRAERLRLDAPELDFESLVLVLGDLMAPLAAFEEAERALR